VDGARAFFFAPSSKREAANARRALSDLYERARSTYEAFAIVHRSVVLSALPHPGCFEEQPWWFRSTVEWLSSRGMLEGPLRGGL